MDIVEILRDGLAERYRIERELGRGGMAAVYLARDLRHDRPLALKVLLPELASTVGAERFLREVQTVASLVHPHILPLYDSGRAGGLLYFVMPYLEGETLADRLEREGPTPVPDAIEIACELADALAYAHAQGVVHRDLKPSNVLLSGGNHVCLADFGLASALDTAGDRRLTHSGVVVGSPLYMSPEQIDGVRAVDGRADVYGLGCLLFEMLSGRPPFHGSTVRSVLHGHLVLAPSSLRRLRPEVPQGVESLVRLAMQKDPEARPDAAEMLARLKRLGGALAGAGAPELDDDPGSGRASDATHPVHVALERSIAVLPFPNRTGDPDCDYLGDGLTEEVINTLGRVGGIRVAARTSSFAFWRSGADVREVGRQLGVECVLEGSVHRIGDRLRVPVQLIATDDGFQFWAGLFERRLDDVYTLQEEIARSIATVLLGKLGRGGERALRHRSTERAEAYHCYLLGRYHWNQRTPDGLTRAVEHFGRAIELDPEYAHAYAGMADAYVAMSQFQYRRPSEVVPLAEAAARRALDLDPSRAEAQSTFAHILDSYYWDWSAAERGYRRAITLDPQYATAKVWLADLLTALGRFDEALALAGNALELEPFSVPIRFQHGTQLYRAGRLGEARAELLRSLEMAPFYFASSVFLAFAAAAAGEPGEGVAVVRQAMEQRAAARLPPVPTLLMPLAYCQARAGRVAEARETLAGLEALAERTFVPAANRSIVYGALGDHDRAFALMRQAQEERFGLFIFVAVDPVFDSLRHDPRFPQVLAAMRLSPSESPPPAIHRGRGAPAPALPPRSGP